MTMDHFDVVVLGAGSAGEVISSQLASAGQTVAVIEDLRVGGECPYVSCMPSKAMLHSAQLHHELVEAQHSAGVPSAAPEQEKRQVLLEQVKATEQITSALDAAAYELT
jgi:pyruvate/2-oxoglutarate dehydrogenase complex dihydrolipoamide dehydrogenase (E3) component